MLCEVCGEREGKHQKCNGDGKHHHHGEVHAHPKTQEISKSDSYLQWMCDECHELDEANWASTRPRREEKR